MPVKKKNTVCFHLHEVTRVVKLTETESRTEVARGGKERGIGGCFWVQRVSVLPSEKVLDMGHTTRICLTLLNCVFRKGSGGKLMCWGLLSLLKISANQRIHMSGPCLAWHTCCA